MIISARFTLSSVLQEKLLVKFSRQYHALMNITFADNQHKFDSRTTTSARIYYYGRTSANENEFLFK